MILTYTPEGATPQTWPFKLDRLTVGECKLLERETGWSYPTEFAQQLARGSIIARHALVFVFLKRADPKLQRSNLDHVTAGSLALDFDVEELAQIRGVVEQDRELDEDTRASVLAQLDEMIAGQEVERAPKGASGTGSSSDSVSSPTSST